MVAKIITLGEIMMRLSTPNHLRFLQASTFDVTYGGGEANVAVSLAQFNQEVHFVSKVPNNPLGLAAINHLKRFGVLTDYIALGGNRLGTYYLELGTSLRASQVIYDRSQSAISLATIDDFDFDAIFKDANWFHFSGITPALSEKAAKITLKALQVAKKYDVTVSVDLNYRKKLWTKEKAQAVMKPLMAYVDICIGNEEDALNVLGYQHQTSDIKRGQLDLDEYKKTLKSLIDDFGFKVALTTLRNSLSASFNKWHALAYDGESFYQSTTYDITPIIDRVGGGDSFAAGLIYGFINKYSLKDSLEFATAASALKHTISGDQNIITIEEVKALVKGDKSGRVKR
ncbi:MAG: PfkB family carbohydrate kinase [Candidatus Izemoplasmataceae bacterium]